MSFIHSPDSSRQVDVRGFKEKKRKYMHLGTSQCWALTLALNWVNIEPLSLFWVAESFTFEDENEYDIKLKVFARVLEKRHPGKLHFTFVIYAEGD